MKRAWLCWSSILSVLSFWITGLTFAQAPIGDPFSLNTSPGLHGFTRVAADSDGNFTVVWRKTSAPVESVVRRFAPDGQPLTAEVPLSIPLPAQDVANRADGQFVVVWTDDDGDDIGVFARRFDGSGLPQGGAFQVNSLTTGRQYGLAADMTPGGDFVVVWSTRPDASNVEVMARRFDAAGMPLGGDFQVNATATGVQNLPDVAMDAAGGFVVAWQDTRASALNPAIFGRRFDSVGMPLGADFEISTAATGQRDPAVDSDGAGNFVVVWQATYQVMARRFADDGMALGAPMLVDSSPQQHYAPQVAVASKGGQPGGFVVAWEEFYYDRVPGKAQAAEREVDERGFSCSECTRARAFDHEGNGGTTHLLSDFVANPAVARQPSGNYLTVWSVSDAVGQFFSGSPMLDDGFEAGDLSGWTLFVNDGGSTDRTAAEP